MVQGALHHCLPAHVLSVVYRILFFLFLVVEFLLFWNCSQCFLDFVLSKLTADLSYCGHWQIFNLVDEIQCHISFIILNSLPVCSIIELRMSNGCLDWVPHFGMHEIFNFFVDPGRIHWKCVRQSGLTLQETFNTFSSWPRWTNVFAVLRGIGDFFEFHILWSPCFCCENPESNFFKIIFLRSLVIPLIPPLIFQKPPMRCYRRTTVENSGWPPLFFNEKPLLPPISNKNAGMFFWYWCWKRRIQSGDQISAKEQQKTLECFLIQNGDYRLPKFSPRKVRENNSKIQFEKKNRHSDPSYPTLFLGVNIVRQLNLHFFPLTS